MIKKIYSSLKNLIINIIIFLFLIFEDIVWEKITLPIYEGFKSLKLILKFQNFVLNIKNDLFLIILFIIPFIIMEFIGFLAGLVLIKGYVFWFIVLYILKGIAMTPILIIFELKKDILLKYKIIELPYKLIQYILHSEIFKNMKYKIKILKTKINDKLNKWKNSEDIKLPIIKNILNKVECFKKCISKNID